jgi:catechol-2,3-dioxygenase
MTGNMTLGTISQISRTVRNIQEAQRWYGEVLGLKHLYSFGNLAFSIATESACSCPRRKTPAAQSRSSIST